MDGKVSIDGLRCDRGAKSELTKGFLFNEGSTAFDGEKTSFCSPTLHPNRDFRKSTKTSVSKATG